MSDTHRMVEIVCDGDRWPNAAREYMTVEDCERHTGRSSRKEVTPRMWMQELLWVRRDERGQIVGIREKPPEGEDFVPVAPRPERKEKATASTVDKTNN